MILKPNTIKKIHHYFSKNIYLKSAFPNILNLLVIFLTVPVTNAECERSFSCLKRLKTWLRSTIGQTRLYSLAICLINSSELKNLDVNKIIDIFASEKHRRMEFFNNLYLCNSFN